MFMGVRLPQSIQSRRSNANQRHSSQFCCIRRSAKFSRLYSSFEDVCQSRFNDWAPRVINHFNFFLVHIDDRADHPKRELEQKPWADTAAATPRTARRRNSVFSHTAEGAAGVKRGLFFS
jgi:hypothetical protein